MTWGSEPSQQWENFFGIIVFQLVGFPSDRYRIYFYCAWAPPLSHCSFFFVFRCGVSFFIWAPEFSWGWFSTASCYFRALAGGDECMSFYSAILNQKLSQNTDIWPFELCWTVSCTPTISFIHSHGHTFGWNLNRRLITTNKYVACLQIVWFSKKDFKNQMSMCCTENIVIEAYPSSCSNKPGFIYKKWSTKIPTIYTFHLPLYFHFNFYYLGISYSLYFSKSRPCFLLFFFLFVVDFVIHWNETAMALHMFPIPISPPTSLSTRSL